MNRKDLTFGSRPRLLVSVKNARESAIAIEGGAEIIDIKEPARGSLGKSDDAVIREIADTVRALDPKLPISSALGELHDWDAANPLPVLPNEVDFVKLGLSQSAGCKDWVADFGRFRELLTEQSARRLSWVTVIYADWQSARAPSPDQILDAIPQTGSEAVLVDTFHKDGRSLWEILPPGEFAALAKRVHGLGLPLAVAGNLRLKDLSRLEPFSPQIIAIRSAACRDGNRNGPISANAVQQFRECLRSREATAARSRGRKPTEKRA